MAIKNVEKKVFTKKKKKKKVFQYNSIFSFNFYLKMNAASVCISVMTE